MRSGDSAKFSFQFFDSGPQGAVQKLGTSEDLESSQDSRVDLICDFELGIRLVLFQGFNNTIFLLFVKANC